MTIDGKQLNDYITSRNAEGPRQVEDLTIMSIRDCGSRPEVGGLLEGEAAAFKRDVESTVCNSAEWNHVLERLMALEAKVFGAPGGNVEVLYEVIDGMPSFLYARSTSSDEL